MIELRFGPLGVAHERVRRSGLRWLVADGARCAAGEPIAYCNLGVAGPGGDAFAGEGFDLQLAFAPVRGGIVRHGGLSHGGFLDRLNSYRWQPERAFARIDQAEGDLAGDADEGVPRLLFLAGRRMSDVAEERSGLLTGWHDRARGWWGEGAPATLLGLGTCELVALLRGERGGFTELFARAPGPGQVIVAQDEPLVPCAAVLAEGLVRTDAERAAIRADMAAGVLGGPHPPAPADWLFLGALLRGLERVPIAEATTVLGRAALDRAPPPAALLLTLTAELPRVARHKRLGYTLAVHDFRLRELGAAVAHWLRGGFEPVVRAPDDIARDWRALLDAVAARTGATVLALSAMSSHAYEDVRGYASFPAPLAQHLASVRAKALNLMLHDLAASHGLALVDADALAAEMGMRAHLPDGVHPSGAFQAELRGELLRVLRARGTAAFG